jgi:hypothetical protein
MNQTAAKLRPGDLVEVKSPDEILQTLDADGTLGQLPFMPEMIELCGKRFQVSKRVLKTCYYTKWGIAGYRKFKTEDVILLDRVRCSGAEHDGCQKSCMIFWREAWLRRAEGTAIQSKVDLAGNERLRARLKTISSPKTYFCQASELLKATELQTRWDRVTRCFREVRAGNCSTFQMAHRIVSWIFWKTRWKLLGEYARGSSKPVPVESLHLQAGEWIEVNSMEGIRKTLNEAGCNRGLFFMPDMRKACGKQRRVERRVEKIIVDGTGQMRYLRDTVFLEGSHCGCVYSLGGCPRNEFSYWREGWLHRSSCFEETKQSNEHEAIEVQS